MSFPHYIQRDAMDCGPTCLRMVAKFYGRSYSLRTLREKCHISREGVSLLGISDAAESIGFHTVGVKITWEQLTQEVTMPCIAHWNQRHFIVVYGILKNRGKYEFLVADPASGLLKYDGETFRKGWLQARDENRGVNDKGIALLLDPTPRFYEEQGDCDRKLGFSYLFKYLRPFKRYVVQLLLAMVVGSLLSMVLPFVTQSVVDKGIGLGNLSSRTAKFNQTVVRNLSSEAIMTVHLRWHLESKP